MDVNSPFAMSAQTDAVPFGCGGEGGCSDPYSINIDIKCYYGPVPPMVISNLNVKQLPLDCNTAVVPLSTVSDTIIISVGSGYQQLLTVDQVFDDSAAGAQCTITGCNIKS